jgi:hypothetical protein
MANSTDSNLQWVHSRLIAEGRVDISDSTMAHCLVTGDQGADLTKYRNLLDR